ncbi:MAG: nucleotidyltransferase domain-containing protein [Candidatus Bathyarchaeia archaeon]
MDRVKVSYPIMGKREVLDRLRQVCVRLKKKMPLLKMILYGSYATGRYTAGSDVDIIVVYDGDEREDAYKLVVDEVALPRLEPKLYTRRQFTSLMARSRKFAETLENEGIVIC